MIEQLFHLLAHPELPWLLAAAIAVSALLLWVRFRTQLATVMAALDRAIALVEQADGPAGFRSRFVSISKELSENPVLGPAWRAYVVTLEPAPRMQDVLGYTRRPQEHFDDSLLLASGFNVRFYQSVPNLLVGLGLLFTFIGLVAALHFASSGVRSPEVAVAQAALSDLLAAATFKFATSIAGLGSSILFSWREKALLHQAQARILRFCHALEVRTVPITAESIALAQLDELRRQTGELRRLAAGNLSAWPETAEQALAEALQAAVAPLRAALAELAARLEREPTWLVQMLTAGDPNAGRRQHGLAMVEGVSRRMLVDELRAIRDLLERMALGQGRELTGPAAARPTGRLADAAETGLNRLLAAVRAVYRRLAGAPPDTNLRRELLPLLRELHARLEEGLAAVRRLQGGEANAGTGDEGSLAGLEAELSRAARQLEELLSRLREPLMVTQEQR